MTERRDLEPSLSRLPSEVAASLRCAIAILRGANLADSAAARDARDASGRKVAEAFFASGFPEAEPISGPSTARPMLADELTAEQRVLVAAYADIEDALNAELEELPHLWGHKLPIPSGAETMRRWIGASDPTALEEEHELNGHRWPLWRHACEGGLHNSKAMTAYIDSLPFAQAVVVMDAVAHRSGYGFTPVRNLYRNARLMRELKDEGVPWARAQIAAWLLAIAVPPRLFRGNPQPQFEHDSALFALMAMARGAVPIEPAWDAFLVCSFDHEPPSFVEAAMAIPEERRHAAAARAVRGWGQNDTKVRKALALLEVFDSADVARAVFEMLPRTIRAKQTVQQLTALSATRPGIAQALAEHKRKLPRPVPLMESARVQPASPSVLSAAQAKQLAAVKKSDPDNFEDTEMVHDLELRVLVGADGKPAFDAWLYATDTGVYFAAGTTKVVAHRIQGGMQAVGKTSPAVLAGLDAMSARRGAPSNMAVRPEPAKTAQKRTATKKAPAKASVATKKKARKDS
jgi:hypothetical protein